MFIILLIVDKKISFKWKIPISIRINELNNIMAETEGFEPSRQLPDLHP